MTNTLIDRWTVFVKKHLKTDGKEIYCYHYTPNLAALEGIAGKSEFWFSHFSKLNDTSEVEHGLDFIDRTISNYMEKARNNCCRVLLQRVQRELKKRGTNEGCGADNFYFVSLTTNGDEKEDVTHWREYANHGEGYALKFSIESSPQVMKVFYLEEDKTTILEKFFEILDPDKDKVSDVTFYLIKLAVLFKHPVFRSESELRIIASRDEGEYLNVHGRLVYKLDEIEKFKLNGIICGPNNHQPETSSEEIKKLFLEKHELNINVSQSTAPVKQKKKICKKWCLDLLRFKKLNKKISFVRK